MPVENGCIKIGDIAGFNIASVVDQQIEVGKFILDLVAKRNDAILRREIDAQAGRRTRKCRRDCGHAFLVDVGEDELIAARIEPRGDFRRDGAATAGNESCLHYSAAML